MELLQGSVDDAVWIDGERRASGGDDRIVADDSFTEQPTVSLRSASLEDVDAAFRRARATQDGWSRVPLAERVQVLERAADLLDAQGDALGAVIRSEVGTVAAQVPLMQVGAGLAAIRLTARWAARVVEHRSAVGASTVIREPAGVVGAITPWNYPLFQVALKVAPALVAGNAVVLKPAGVAPATAYALASALKEAGLPDGVLAIVPGDGPTIGAAVAGHPDADFVSFTGSVRAGRLVAQAAGASGTRTSLELGGKSAAVVLERPLLEEAVAHTVANTLANAGQTCAALTRLIVPRAALADAEGIAADLVAAQLVGDPADPATTVGPLASAAQRDQVLRHIEHARSAPGVRIVAGGDEVPPVGWFAPPTVLSADAAEAAVVREEVFGPVLVIQPADDEQHAVALANGTPFGLLARVWTADGARFERVARALRAGGVIQNGTPTVWDAPFGGVKDSGYGRERGPYGIEEYLVTKSLQPAV